MEIKQTAEYRKWFKKLRNREAKAAIQHRFVKGSPASKAGGELT